MEATELEAPTPTGHLFYIAVSFCKADLNQQIQDSQLYQHLYLPVEDLAPLCPDLLSVARGFVARSIAPIEFRLHRASFIAVSAAPLQRALDCDFSACLQSRARAARLALDGRAPRKEWNHIKTLLSFGGRRHSKPLATPMRRAPGGEIVDPPPYSGG